MENQPEPTTELVRVPSDKGYAFSNIQNFESAQRMAVALYSTTIVPKEYQGKENMGNCIVALEMAQRMQLSPLTVMQNLYIIHGRPSWSSQFIISAINSCGKFSPLRYEWFGTEGADDWACRAYAVELATGEVLRGSKITMGMAKAEGWVTKAGSKWKTMPEQMMIYRASAFFGRIYAPEILNGLHSEHEVEDVYSPNPKSGFDKLNEVIDIPAEEVKQS